MWKLIKLSEYKSEEEISQAEAFILWAKAQARWNLEVSKEIERRIHEVIAHQKNTWIYSNKISLPKKLLEKCK